MMASYKHKVVSGTHRLTRSLRDCEDELMVLNAPLTLTVFSMKDFEIMAYTPVFVLVLHSKNYEHSKT